MVKFLLGVLTPIAVYIALKFRLWYKMNNGDWSNTLSSLSIDLGGKPYERYRIRKMHQERLRSPEKYATGLVGS